MLPTLKQGQDVLVLCWPRFNRGWFLKLKVGDIVAIKVNGKEMIKRIHYCNDRIINVLGDNEKESTDSRKFGPIKKEQTIGKVVWY